jgi:hypothetical protein
MKLKLKKYKKLFYPSLAVFIVFIWAFFILSKYQISFKLSKNTQTSPKLAATESFANLASQIVADCSKVPYKPTCYEEKVPALMDRISMQDAFKVTHLVQQDDPSYTYCHVLGHKLAANEVAKDPSKWLEVVDMCPSGECSNGCIHGAFQQRFRQEALTPDQYGDFIPQVENVCEKRAGWDPTGLEQGTCYHALGHLMMYVTSADIGSSLSMCDKVSVKDNGQRNYSKLCYDGAFMQIFQPLENEDLALVKGKQPTKDQLSDYCSKFSTLRQTSCWNEGWPLFSKEIMTPSGVVNFCTNLKGVDSQSTCYTDLFYVVTAEVQFDTEFMKNYCSKLPSTVSGKCFSNTASRLIETDYSNIEKSVSFCESALSKNDQSQCFNELIFYSTFNFHPQSEEFFKLCNALPDTWKNKCLNNKVLKN